MTLSTVLHVYDLLANLLSNCMYYSRVELSSNFLLLLLLLSRLNHGENDWQW
jgi:hypothetical protein